ncbi:DUF421 domain-containing protein [Cytobacillus spongiae]|jgi:uncharacterized membrane protein YcaP (DUF421 family)|uniref:DUF421 domain-containing protein n=1 Tax=Cytobacillus spongiae TaxID=2901381 RepID=UPI001F35624E|nr:DUF421 domain-containing protein [Cytobacillus spongiae]UII57052.1 DUF421 domain-containing protein [Cytobacillus spongiae]
MEYVHITTEIIVGFFALLLVTKILGKTQITQITAFDFISALVLGELVGNALFDQEAGIGEILFSITLWGALIYAIEFTTQKSRKLRKFLEGDPSIVIRKGKIDFNALKKNHLDVNQLQHLLRSKDVFSLSECEYAILETDGTVSVLKKPEYTNPTAQDLSLPIKPVDIPVSVVIDGEILYDHLPLTSFDEKSLKEELGRLGYQSIPDILYAEYKEGEALHVQTY